MTPEDAGVLISVLTARQSYLELVNGQGWTFDEAARWVEETLARNLLTAQ